MPDAIVTESELQERMERLKTLAMAVTPATGEDRRRVMTLSRGLLAQAGAFQRMFSGGTIADLTGELTEAEIDRLRWFASFLQPLVSG